MIIIKDSFIGKWYVQAGLVILIKWVNSNLLPKYLLKGFVGFLLNIVILGLIIWWIYNGVNKINSRLLERNKV